MKNNSFIKIIVCTILLAVGTSCLYTQTQESTRLLFINEALKYLGTPYKYASTTKEGMDCSGLIYRSALDSINMSLPRSASDIAEYAQTISEEELQAGDLLFFVTFGNKISHVGIYLGDGQFIHSASAGPKTGVIVSNLDEKYWAKAYIQAGRILPPEEAFSYIYSEKN